MTALNTTSVFNFWRGEFVTEAEGFASLLCDAEEAGDHGDPPYTGDGDQPEVTPTPPNLNDVLRKLNPEWTPSPLSAPPSEPRPARGCSQSEAMIESRAVKYLATLPASIQGSNGSLAALWAARVLCWGFNLGAERGCEILMDNFNPRCEPPWAEGELRKKCTDAMNPAGISQPRGWLLDTPPDRIVRTPTADDPAVDALVSSVASGREVGQGRGPAAELMPSIAPPAAELMPSISPPPVVAPVRVAVTAEVAPVRVAGVAPDDPCHLASLYIALPENQHADGTRLRAHHGKFANWADGAYATIPDDIVRAGIVKNVEAEFMRLHEAGYAIALANAEKGQRETAATRKAATKLKVSRQLIGDVLQCLQARCQLPEGLDAPGWIGDGPPPSGLIAARNGILDLQSFAAGNRELLPATPRYFTYNRLDFEIDLNARTPAFWIRFLDTLWPNDPDSIRCLQEWFGYLLTPDTSLQKMLMLIGPPRAGKGIIGRILKALIGEGNVVSPTMASLSERFGLQPLIGKTVALFTDARLSGRADSVAVGEQLLSIAGEDPRTIDRKGIGALTTRLGTRFVFMSNELPRFGEASGALVSRLVILRLTQTFLGREDIGLFNRLAPELPGILLWSVEGWKRLKASGRFTVPESAHDLTDEAEDLASPVKRFLREQCELGDTEEHSARKCDLFEAWQRWSRRQGRDNPGFREVFFRDLRAAVPTLQAKRARNGQERIQCYTGIRILSPIETGEIE